MLIKEEVYKKEKSEVVTKKYTKKCQGVGRTFLNTFDCFELGYQTIKYLTPSDSVIIECKALSK